MEIEYIAVIVCGICLLAIFLALIFNTSFRKDLIAKEGKMNFLGASVEGVIIVLLVTLLMIGIIYPIKFYNDRKKTDSGNPSQIIKIGDHPFDAKNKIEALQKTHSLTEKNSQPKEIDLVSEISKLKYDDAISEEIRKFPAENKGPWSLNHEAQATYFYIPEKNTPKFAVGCTNQFNNTYEIRYRPEKNEERPGESVDVTIIDRFTIAEDCKKIYDYIQVSCDIATKVIGKEKLTCSSKNTPLWHTANQKVPIWLTLKAIAK